jgi:CubicO group peptidase (beta-lactamase class C family)
LTHTSGIPELPIFETLVQERPDRHELLRRACTDPLRFAPGSRYEYGSNSFYVLGELIRRLSGLDYPDYLAQRVLGPLGMSRTSFDPLSAPGSVPLDVAGYDPVEVAAAGSYFTSLAHPGGGLWATAADIVRFGRAFLGRGSLDGERILSPAFVELMTREQTAGIFEEGVPPRAPHYGLGWWKAGLEVDLPGSATAFAHTGATGTILWVDPDADLVVVYLMNVWGAAETHRLAALQAIYACLD